MIKELPSFQIEVTEENSTDSKNIVHRIGINTSRICRDVKPGATPVDQVQMEKKNNELVATIRPKVFYTNVAKELSALDEGELSANFADLRVCFKHTRSEKKYEFTF